MEYVINNKQDALNVFETIIVKEIFGTTEFSAGTKTVLRLAGFDIDRKMNNIIEKFETFMKPLVLDDGKVDVQALRDLVSLKYPKLVDIVPQENFDLVAVAEKIKPLIQGIKNA